MSYITMDHAAWMESNLRAINRCAEKGLRKRKSRTPVIETLNPFQRRVVQIVGIVGNGIYNAPICASEKITWTWGHTGVSLTWKREMATWDFNTLTTLVFLCHEARIRLSIEAVAPRIMRLSFWQREAEGGMATRHPNLAEAVESFQKCLPPEHNIRYENKDREDFYLTER
jgi:hypothetical protein